MTEIPADDVPVDSKEGIEFLMRWAKAHDIVLTEAHEEIARRYGVSTDGVMISRPMPMRGRRQQ